MVHQVSQQVYRCGLVLYVCVDRYDWLWSSDNLTVKPIKLAGSLKKSAIKLSDRTEVHAGIATSNDDISGCGGWFCFVPGPLKSPLRALSTVLMI